jgi:hypothetical protein
MKQLILKPHYKPSPEGEGWVRGNSNVALLAMSSIILLREREITNIPI